MVLDKLIPALCMLLVLMHTSIKAEEEEERSCGRTNPSRIAGGAETKENEFPMAATIIYKPKKESFCGCTIITNKHVITAAYCVEDLDDQIEDLQIGVGVHNVKTALQNDPSRFYDVRKFVVHPEYDSDTHKNDVAIITLKKALQFSMTVNPACLPFNYVDTNFVNETVTALGWGSLKNDGKKSDVLRKVDLTVVKQSKCKNLFKDYTKDMICTQSHEKGICKSDSGGPILWRNSTSEHTMLIAVISYGKTCGDNNPSVSMRVTSFLNFIQENTPGYKYCKTY